MEDDYLEDFIIEESTTREVIQEGIELALESAELSSRERELIIWKYGIPGGPFKTYEAVSLKFDTDPKSIRKIEEKVFMEYKQNCDK